MPGMARIMDRAPLKTEFTRAALGLLAVSHLVTAWATAALPWLRWSGAWATLFLAAGLAVGIAAIWLRLETVVVAGALTETAFAMRSGVILLARFDGTLSTEQVTQGVATWLGFCFVGWGVIFLRGVVPLVADTDKRRRDR